VAAAVWPPNPTSDSTLATATAAVATASEIVRFRIAALRASSQAVSFWFAFQNSTSGSGSPSFHAPADHTPLDGFVDRYTCAPHEYWKYYDAAHAGGNLPSTPGPMHATRSFGRTCIGHEVFRTPRPWVQTDVTPTWAPLSVGGPPYYQETSAVGSLAPLPQLHHGTPIPGISRMVTSQQG
jgi:hypothetical protein